MLFLMYWFLDPVVLCLMIWGFSGRASDLEIASTVLFSLVISLTGTFAVYFTVSQLSNPIGNVVVGAIVLAISALASLLVFCFSLPVGRSVSITLAYAAYRICTPFLLLLLYMPGC